MYKFGIVIRGSTNRKLRDQSGGAGVEWVVAAAIVVLFAVPVMLLVKSGAMTSSEPVVEVLTSANTDTAFKGYTANANLEPSENGSDEGKPAIPGLNKGVGFEVSEEAALNGDFTKYINPENADAGSRSRRTTTTRGTTARDSVSFNTSSTFRRSDVTGLRVMRLKPSDIRRDKPVKRPIISVGATVIPKVVDVPVAPTDKREERSVTTRTTVTCMPEKRAKFIEREPDFDLGGGIDEDLFSDGGAIVEDKKRELFRSDEIQILDGADTEAQSDCVTEPAIVTAAGEQLGDGTVLGMVTISTASDRTPSRHRAPAGLNPGFGNQGGTSAAQAEEASAPVIEMKVAQGQALRVGTAANATLDLVVTVNFEPAAKIIRSGR